MPDRSSRPDSGADHDAASQHGADSCACHACPNNRTSNNLSAHRSAKLCAGHGSPNIGTVSKPFVGPVAGPKQRSNRFCPDCRAVDREPDVVCTHRRADEGAIDSHDFDRSARDHIIAINSNDLDATARDRDTNTVVAVGGTNSCACHAGPNNGRSNNLCAHRSAKLRAGHVISDVGTNSCACHAGPNNGRSNNV